VKNRREAAFFEAIGYVAKNAVRFNHFDEIGVYVAKHAA
jgi:hypothetical protein